MQALQFAIIVISLTITAVAIYLLWRNSGNGGRQAMLTLARHMPDPVLITNKDGKVVAYSPAACQLFGYQPDEIVELTVEQLMPPEFAEHHRQIRKGFMQKNRGQAMDNEITCLSKHGERITAVTRVRTFVLDGESYAYVSIHDIRHFKDREALLKHLSEQDPLTGLANRRLFDHDMQREWQRALRSNQPLTVLMIDIDYFKQFNDYYGHPAGDTCLKVVADIIQNAVQRATDCVARYGGEEFICLMPSLNSDEAVKKAEQIRTAVETEKIPHKQSQCGDYVTVSIGVATLIPQENLDTDLLVAKADAALYNAKGHGRNCVKTSGDLLAE